MLSQGLSWEQLYQYCIDKVIATFSSSINNLNGESVLTFTDQQQQQEQSLLMASTIISLSFVLLIFLSIVALLSGANPVEAAFRSWLPGQKKNAKVKKRGGESNLLRNIIDAVTTTENDEQQQQQQQQAASSSSNQWWNDLAPPFSFSEDLYDEKNEADSIGLPTDHPEGYYEPHVTHFCFLVHGHRGFSRDLSYLQHVMEYLADREKRRQWSSCASANKSLSTLSTKTTTTTAEDTTSTARTTSCDSVTSESSTASSALLEGQLSDESEAAAQTATMTTTTVTAIEQPMAIQDMVIHSSVCNEKRTTDGIENGGERLVDEIMTVIRQEMDKQAEKRKKRQQQQQKEQSSDGIERNSDNDNDRQLNEDEVDLKDITISVVGNSLGGLYGRYALAKLAERCVPTATDDDENDACCWVLDGRYRVHFNIFCTTATPHLGVSKHTYLTIPRAAEIRIANSMGDTGKDLFRLNDLLKNMATSSHYLNPLKRFRKRIAYANAYMTDFVVPVTTAAFLSEGSTYPHHFSDNDRDRGGGQQEITMIPKNEQDNDNDTTASDDIDQSEVDANDSQSSDSGPFVATFHTHPSTTTTSHAKGQSSSSVAAPSTGDQILSEDHQHHDELVQMSTSLDSLGWKKVFVDIRKEIPLNVNLPKNININLIRRNSDSSSLNEDEHNGNNSSDDDDDSIISDHHGNNGHSKSNNNKATAIGTATETENPVTMKKRRRKKQRRKRQHQKFQRSSSRLGLLKQRRVVESRDVFSAVCVPDDNRLSLPLGHNMIVALSRTRVLALFNKGGRPVVDALAKELVEDIFAWTKTKANPTATL